MTETTDNIYSAIERQLRDSDFNVKHLMRDSRGDWGDDGGYLISVSEKNNKIYLHIIGVNHNSKIHSNVLDETDQRVIDQGDTEIPDYIICSSIEDAQLKINEFVKDLHKVVELVEDDCYFFENGYTDNEQQIPKEFKGYDEFYLSMLSNCWFSFSEYTQIDEPILLNLFSTKYVPDYTDPEEYLED